MTEDRCVTYYVGEGSRYGIVPGIESALRWFTVNEKSRLWMKACQAYGESGCPELDIPPNSDIEYEVELKKMNQASFKVAPVFYIHCKFCKSG